MLVQLPEGRTTYSASSKTSRVLLARGLASSQYPALKAGWPQQVWPSGKSTSTPRALRSLTAATPASA